MSSRLILSEYQNNQSLITPVYESIANSPLKEKRLKLHGTAIVCDEPGYNGRTYPTRLMTRESKKFTDTYIKNFNSLGELNHPPVDEEGNARLLPVTEINLEKVSHIIELLGMEGNHMKIKFRIVEKTPCGAILKALLDDGIPVGVSLRGLGSVYRDGGKNIVADDYDLITVDVVGRPSYGKAAMMQSMMEATSNNKIQLLTECENPAILEAISEFRNEVDASVRSGTFNKTQFLNMNTLLNKISN